MRIIAPKPIGKSDIAKFFISITVDLYFLYPTSELIKFQITTSNRRGGKAFKHFNLIQKLQCRNFAKTFQVHMSSMKQTSKGNLSTFTCNSDCVIRADVKKNSEQFLSLFFDEGIIPMNKLHFFLPKLA